MRNPQSSEALKVRQMGPTPNRRRCASIYALQSASCRVEPVPTKKADAEPDISFARRSSAFSRRSFLNSSDSPGSVVFVVSERSCHRRNDSVAIPRSFATPCKALVSDV